MKKPRRLTWLQFFAVLGLFAAVIAVFLAIVSCVRRDEKTVCFEAEYYFLVELCEDSTAAAVTGKVYGAGGAGVLLGGGRAVVVACYYTEREAERVQSALREKGEVTRIDALSAEAFDLSGADAVHAERVAANAETAETCARLLYDAANGLERAQMGQSEAQAAARGAARSLAGLIEGNGDRFYDRWNAALAAVKKDCAALSEGIVFAKDLRRLQARLLCLLVDLHSYFR